MTKRMLIDSTHAEETRVVVLDGNRLEEFDVETSTKQNLKGNIYLARVVRVEPSLQAAFVEFGGNRHGFLAFGEIHPDYYQIPVADRQRLLAMAEADAAADEEQDEDPDERGDERGDERADDQPAPHVDAAPQVDHAAPEPEAAPAAEASAPEASTLQAPTPEEPAAEAPAAEAPFSLDIPAWDAPEPPRPEAPSATPPAEADDGTEAEPQPRPPHAQPARIDTDTVSAEPGSVDEAPLPRDFDSATQEAGEQPAAEQAPEDAAEDAAEEPLAPRASEVAEVIAEPVAPETIGGGGENGEDDRRKHLNARFLRHYKIQEVIKRRQILLVQVVKEERGTKGAALTTYLSLAGRYSVLMPNTPRGGGISRKISSATDRKRLREVMTELALPKGMGIIVRTAGAARPKAEIKRDCEYLLRLWDSIRETTLASVAPALIYEEANLIKRAIRDVYSRDVDEVLVDGEDAYRAAKDFMRMLIPSHAKKVQLYRDGGVPLFARAGVEAQLDAMHNARVELRSGGSIVINQTEALVAIDVNSGRATRERNIEETAFKTNCEAADEIARQLRLRDLAGLIVIDFIDMETSRNNAAVERRLKEALKHDRARIQVGRISHFGLMEMSRQRLRPSLAETAFITCPHCTGTGLVRSTESAAVQVLRAIEDEAAKRRAGEIIVRCAGSVALYLLNMKRARLGELEAAFAMRILFAADDTLLPPALKIERTKPPVLLAPGAAAPVALPPPMISDDTDDDDEVEDIADLEDDEAEPQVAPERAAPAPRRGGERRPQGTAEQRPEGRPEGRPDARPEARAESAEAEGERKRKRRRRRRGGRREDGAAPNGAAANGTDASADTPPGMGDQPDLTVQGAAEDEDAAPRATEAEGGPPLTAEEEEARARRRRGRRGGRRRRREDETGAEAPVGAAPEGEGEAEAEPPPPPPAPRPPFQGATPANPFGNEATFDLFDAIDAELSAAPPPRVVPPQPEVPTEPVIVQAVAEPVAEPVTEPVTEPAAEAATLPSPASVAPEAAAPETTTPAEGTIASMEVRPIVVDEAAAEAPKKRGWWRR